MQGTIIKSTGSWYLVRTAEGLVWNCRIKGKFKLKDYKLTNPVAVGDIVKFDTEKEEGHGIITDIQPRNNFVLRRSTRQKHFMHLIACNVDQAFVIVTIKRPNIKPGFIDRFLLTTESYNIPTYIIFNKCDIYDAEDLELYEALKVIYKNAGYQTMLVSAENGQGLDELKALLKDKTTLISGHSGVGKSSLVNAIQPQFELRTGDISGITDKGMHTTTFAEMFELDFGGRIIDTPGIKELGFLNMEPKDISHNFPEIFALSPKCKYSNCLHINEPHCAVKSAIEKGEIHSLRYQSYLSIMEEVMDQKHWERHDM
jgi:ribosome biogenesis GTPase